LECEPRCLRTKMNKLKLFGSVFL